MFFLFYFADRLALLPFFRFRIKIQSFFELNLSRRAYYHCKVKILKRHSSFRLKEYFLTPEGMLPKSLRNTS